jgi:hypothetical protein
MKEISQDLKYLEQLSREPDAFIYFEDAWSKDLVDLLYR